MKRINFFTALLVLMMGVGFAGETAKINEAAPDFTLTDSNGESHALSDFKGKFVVLEWVNYDCPFVRKHYDSGNMQKLQKSYTEKGVIWLSICSSAEGKQGYFAGDELNERIKEEKAAGTAYLIDADGMVGKMYGAKTTPHMYIIDPDGKLVYAGGIDDKKSTKIADIKDANNYVQLALDAAMAGEEIEIQTSSPYGCSVKYE